MINPIIPAYTTSWRPTMAMSSPSSSQALQTFEKALQRPKGVLPEVVVGEAAQEAMVAWRSPYANLVGPTVDWANPSTALQFLQRLTRANLQLEIAAKVVGSAGQTINRLVSMQ